MIDRDSGRLRHDDSTGEGTAWWTDAEDPECTCQDSCLDACEARGCRGYILALRASSGLRFPFDPDTCPKVQ